MTAAWRKVPASGPDIARVDHVGASGESCGPLIPTEAHHRAGELPRGGVICAACGHVIEVPRDVAAYVRRCERAYQRAEAREEELSRLRIDHGAEVVDRLLAATPKRARGKRPVQTKIPGT